MEWERGLDKSGFLVLVKNHSEPSPVSVSTSHAWSSFPGPHPVLEYDILPYDKDGIPSYFSRGVEKLNLRVLDIVLCSVVIFDRLAFYVAEDNSCPLPQDLGMAPWEDSTNDISHYLGMLDPWYERNVLGLMHLPPEVLCQVSGL